MEMQLCEMLGELHGVGKRPLMCSYFASRCSHEDSSDFIDDKELSDVVGVGPHDCKLLRSSFSVELGDRLRIADSHDVEDGVIGSSQAFIALVPNFKYLVAFAGHNHGASIGEQTLNEHVLIKKVQFLHEIP